MRELSWKDAKDYIKNQDIWAFDMALIIKNDEDVDDAELEASMKEEAEGFYNPIWLERTYKEKEGMLYDLRRRNPEDYSRWQHIMPKFNHEEE